MSTSTSIPPFPTGPPPLPPGKDKHHIVVLEGIHAPTPTFSFPHTITIHQNSTPSQIASRIRDATIAISCVVPITPSDMDQAPHLGVLAVMAVGISWVDKADCARRGVTVTKCPAGNVDAVGEHFLTLYFAARKRVVQVHNTLATTSDWPKKGTLTKLWPNGPPRGAGQEKLGILGYGTLGTRVEKLARAVGFGEVVVAERKGAKEVRMGRVSFEEVLKTCTVIVLTLPKEDDTVDLIGEKELKTMQQDALIINIARGGIVNEVALAKALREGWIAGAAVDVLETEPAGVGTSPLLPDMSKPDAVAVPNLTVSSHIAWFTQSTIVRYQELLKQGIEGWVNGTLREAEDKVDKTVVVHQGRIWS
ncbi:hypothetical protein B0A52_03823 [Exophiala mesophila]|uniref:D-isomer specific 2-hydroxyacid dehydrogenase NAD-binding domain-containing protein n=1 Tax=Exophiala mesophila TaxID=212818 RepID=A0A438N7N2_EXOME|nr:hypothetical protein B0A52_03823 [Exophiala mesophila]